MGCKIPSKYTKLSTLLEIQSNNYCGKDGVNYEQYYIDELIMIKQGNNADKTNTDLIKTMGDKYEIARTSDEEATTRLLNSLQRSRKMNLKKPKTFNEFKNQLTEREVDAIVDILGYRCHQKTKNRLS